MSCQSLLVTGQIWICPDIMSGDIGKVIVSTRLYIYFHISLCKLVKNFNQQVRAIMHVMQCKYSVTCRTSRQCVLLDSLTEGKLKCRKEHKRACSFLQQTPEQRLARLQQMRDRQQERSAACIKSTIAL